MGGGGGGGTGGARQRTRSPARQAPKGEKPGRLGIVGRASEANGPGPLQRRPSQWLGEHLVRGAALEVLSVMKLGSSVKGPDWGSALYSKRSPALDGLLLCGAAAGPLGLPRPRVRVCVCVCVRVRVCAVGSEEGEGRSPHRRGDRNPYIASLPPGAAWPR
jgi:hypothetical protein